MDPNSLPDHLRKYFNAAAASSSLAASFAALNQVHIFSLITFICLYLSKTGTKSIYNWVNEIQLLSDSCCGHCH